MSTVSMSVIEIVLNVLNQVGGWVPNQYICTTETDLMYIYMYGKGIACTVQRRMHSCHV